jgi:hypothetical protein
MAKRKKQSKVQKRVKLPRRNSAKRGKARRVSRAAKRTVARAKPKYAAAKKAMRKVKAPVTPVVETVEVIEQPAPGVITERIMCGRGLVGWRLNHRLEPLA